MLLFDLFPINCPVESVCRTATNCTVQNCYHSNRRSCKVLITKRNTALKDAQHRFEGKERCKKEKQNYSFAREKICAYEELIRCNLRVRATGTIGKSVFCLTVTSHFFWKVWLIHLDWARKSLRRSLSAEALTGNKKMKPIALVSLF